MFGHNEVAGQRFFRESEEAAVGKLLVTSVFRTIQGEGPFAGCPAVFVRLAKCQLQCQFCDTYFDSGTWMSVTEIVERMKQVCRGGPFPPLVVVTGGEPTLQNFALEMFARAIHGGYFPPFASIQIETNGLIMPQVPRNATVVVSPKCAGKHYTPLLPGVLERANCLKFVLSGDPASPYHAVPDWALEWRDKTRREIFVSPMAEYNHAPGQTRRIFEARRDPSIAEREAAEVVSFWEPGLLDMEACRRNYEYAGRYALETNLRLSIQMHLFASMA